MRSPCFAPLEVRNDIYGISRRAFNNFICQRSWSMWHKDLHIESVRTIDEQYT